MKGKVILALLAGFACSCQQQQASGMDNEDDQNFQDRRRKMQQDKCCEAEKADLQQKQAAVAPTLEKKAEK